MGKTMKGECVMGGQKVKFASRAAPEVLARMPEIARVEGRQFRK